jgi:hypothetical protein
MSQISIPKIVPIQMHLDNHISYLDWPRSAPMARTLGLFSKYPIRWGHGRTPVLKGGIGIHGGEVGQRITALARCSGRVQDQYQKVAAVEAATVAGSPATGGNNGIGNSEPRREVAMDAGGDLRQQKRQKRLNAADIVCYCVAINSHGN